MVFAGGSDFDDVSKRNKLKKENLTAIISTAVHFIITNYQVQIFDANSGIIKNYVEIVKE